jgi:hypothetical protein
LLWPNGLGHYVESHELVLPGELVSHALPPYTTATRHRRGGNLYFPIGVVRWKAVIGERQVGVGTRDSGGARQADRITDSP